MTLLVSIVAILFVGLSGLSAFMLIANRGSGKILEILLPALGALMIAGYYIFKEVWVERPEPKRTSFVLLNVEYNKGHVLPIQNLLLNQPSKAWGIQPYAEYITRWREMRTAAATPEWEAAPEPTSPTDSVLFEIGEAIILKELTDKFALGWEHDFSNTSVLPFGRSGVGSYGVPGEYLEKVFLKRDFYASGNNRFIDADPDPHYQLAVPKGSKVALSRDGRAITLRIESVRFKFSMNFDMGASVFTPTARTDNPFYGFYKALHERLGYLNPDKGIGEMRERVISFTFNFEQNPFLRFSAQAQYDASFGKNLAEYFKQHYAWESVAPLIEQVISTQHRGGPRS